MLLPTLDASKHTDPTGLLARYTTPMVRVLDSTSSAENFSLVSKSKVRLSPILISTPFSQPIQLLDLRTARILVSLTDTTRRSLRMRNVFWKSSNLSRMRNWLVISIRGFHSVLSEAMRNRVPWTVMSLPVSVLVVLRTSMMRISVFTVSPTTMGVRSNTLNLLLKCTSFRISPSISLGKMVLMRDSHPRKMAKSVGAVTWSLESRAIL
mmetsp:Transcript_40374/g.65414  ORF Transcript_40374/g.65414 Transcript_40374/m.65414 type:complete len:209 (-) Transcript_40374:4048-4674(-)